MRISIFGLGYVGAVTAGCLTQQGHQVVGVDVSSQKVETLNRGEAPIIEPGLEELLKHANQQGLLRATSDAAEAVSATDVSFVCVGTPSTISGSLDLRFVRQVAERVAAALRARPKSHVLIFRSTMLPHSTERMVDETAGLFHDGELRDHFLESAARQIAGASIRALAAAFSFVVLFLGFFWIIWDKDRQGWHDKIAGTVVVRLPRGTPLVCL